MEAIKIIALYIGTGIANFFLSIIYLSLSGLPGGSVGMAPFLIIILSGITLVISTALYWVMRIGTNHASMVRAVIIYNAVYFLILAFSWIEDGTDDPAMNEFLFWAFLLSFLVGLVLVVVLWRREKQKAVPLKNNDTI